MNTIAIPDRADYMSGKLTHQEYYLTLARAIGLTANVIPPQCTKAHVETSPNLNNVPLNHWDARHQAVRAFAARAGIKSWSLSDSVCTLKAFARFHFTGVTK